jgi:nicotinamide-nucleotide amidase
MTVAILSLGTELTRGELVNENGAWLADRLTELGHEVVEITTVDDDDARIEQALERLAQDHAVIVCTGGLGPTTDDRTSACAARVIAAPLVLDPVARGQLEAALARRNRALGPDNEKQAFVPSGATILPNERGTAPGFSVMIERACAFFLPGVPAEMREMFELEVRPRLPEPAESWLALYVRTCGLPESEIGLRLAGIEAAHDVTIGYRASVGGVAIKVLVRSSPRTAADARQRAEAAWAEVSRRLVPAVYSTSNAPIERALGDLLVERNLSIALAESCTGGGASALLSRVPGSSRYLRGAIVAYDNRVKCASLGVPAELLSTHGAVSQEVAEAMALGVRAALAADLGVAITGIAGPDGGSDDKPVGLVHWAVAWGQKVMTFQACFSGSRNEIQKRAAIAALFSTWKVVNAG